MDEETRKTFDNLKLTYGEDDSSTVTKFNGIINLLTREAEDTRTLASKELIADGMIQTIVAILERDDALPELKSKSAALIAELAKIDEARKLCTELPVIPLLIKLLHFEDPELALQGCRSLGNICYENNEGRSIVNENNGTEALFQLLKNNLKSGEKANRLRIIATGFLFNLTNTYESTQEKVLEAGVINIFCEYLEQYPEEEELCMHILLTLICIIETELGRQKLMETNMCQTLINLLEKNISCEVTDNVLELLNSLAENDAIKFQLATSNLSSIIIKLIHLHRGKSDDDSIEIVKTATELIILLLTGDDSMVHLYKEGEGQIYLETVSWLDSQDEVLQIAGALSIGNFATKDEHCIQMVSSGLSNKLTSIIHQHNTREGDIRLQHAVLGALRNLAIPAANKPVMISKGVVEAILPMTSVETFPVVFKLLGTLRMLVDKQETIACSLGQNESFLSHLIEWCGTNDHPGVKGEANRLLAWVIKNSKSNDVMNHVTKSGGLPFLVSMANSEHWVMQNESLIALTLVAASILDVAETDLHSADIAEQLVKLLKEESTADEVKSNALTLITTLLASEKIAGQLKESGILSSIQDLISSSDSPLSQQAQKLEALFGSS